MFCSTEKSSLLIFAFSLYSSSNFLLISTFFIASYNASSLFSQTIPQPLLINSSEPLTFVLITGTPRINASVHAVLSPSLYDEQTYKSAFFTNLYGLTSKPIFATCQRLQYILGTPLDCSNVTNFSNTFSNAQSLVEIRFTPNTIKGSLSFSNSPLLSNESINSIINGLDALNTSPTLTLHSSIKNSLTNEQLNTISSKGWNIL